MSKVLPQTPFSVYRFFRSWNFSSKKNDLDLTRKSMVFVCTLLLNLNIYGQSTNHLQQTEPGYHIADRLSIKHPQLSAHLFLQPINRKDFFTLAYSIDTLKHKTLTKLDQSDLTYVYNDNNEWFRSFQPDTSVRSLWKKVYIDSSKVFYTFKEEVIKEQIKGPQLTYSKSPVLRYFYKTPANLWAFDNKFFSVRLNPILHFQAGYEKHHAGTQTTFENKRGFTLRGHIDERVFFYTKLIETQADFSRHVKDQIDSLDAVPGFDYFKRTTNPLSGEANEAYDYLYGEGYVGFNITKHVGLQFGHGKHFLGNGIRSLLLSDYSAPYFYLKLNTKVWKFNYQNIFAELTRDYTRGFDKLLDKKYIASHYLSYNILPQLQLGVFETVVFGRDRGFELQYLNPIIFYRHVERALGSPDNVLLGFNGNFNFLKRFSIYGQFILDEFVLSELFIDNNGSWVNKFGYQLGLKYIDVAGIDHLDLQLELNSVRPYTYSYDDKLANYTHYNQPLAHPLGANFNEYIARLNYQPHKNIFLEGWIQLVSIGRDSSASNWGSDVFANYQTRESSTGNFTGQGVNSKITSLNFKASYMFRHNLFFDLNLNLRTENSVLDRFDKTSQYITFGMRWNIWERPRML